MNKKAILTGIIAVLVIAGAAVFFCSHRKIKIDVLILPKFEIDEISGDYIGEAQLYYEGYCMGGEEYELQGDNPLYVKDGVALCLAGEGKVNAATTLTEILEDERFDLSDAYIISTGCGGGSTGSCIMGDVIIATAAVDYDLGHHADPREMEDPSRSTWFRDSEYDDTACMILDSDLTDRIYECVKDTELETTENTVNYLKNVFDNAEWVCRDPKVLKGTCVTADNYWKGEYDHANAVYMCEDYGCPDMYAVSEMEDTALADVADKYGMLDRFIIIRDIVNEDTFMGGNTPESLWLPEYQKTLEDEDSTEAADIFETAMENNYRVGSRVIDMLLGE